MLNLLLYAQSIDGQTVWLHGNSIIWKVASGYMISACGWRTNTTKERLNALPKVSINQVKGIWYLNGKEWDGSPTLISNV